MDDIPKNVGDIESFIDMLRAACEDKHMHHTPERVLSQPNAKRKETVLLLAENMTNKGAPTVTLL